MSGVKTRKMSDEKAGSRKGMEDRADVRRKEPSKRGADAVDKGQQHRSGRGRSVKTIVHRT